MLKSVMQAVNDCVSFPYRYAHLTKRLTPLLQDVNQVLDVGPGDGRLTRHLMDATGCYIVGLDVCLQPEPYVEIHNYDGCVFPFADNSFDCALMVDMLHHTDNIEQMVAEARRVARDFVIIKDHYWKTRADMIALHIADYIGNIPYNVPLPYNYLRLEEWESLFSRHNLGTVNQSTFKFNALEPAYHIMVKLEIGERSVAASANGKVAQKQNHELQPV